MTTSSSTRKRGKTPEEEIAELRARRPTRNQVPRGFYRDQAPPEYFEERERAKQNICEVLDLILRAKDIGAGDLAKIMGLSEPAVRHRLYGRSLFTADEIWAIAQQLGVDVNLIMDPDLSPAAKVKAVKKAAESADT